MFNCIVLYEWLKEDWVKIIFLILLADSHLGREYGGIWNVYSNKHLQSSTSLVVDKIHFQLISKCLGFQKKTFFSHHKEFFMTQLGSVECIYLRI